MADRDRERWDTRYRDGTHGEGAIPAWLGEFESEWPSDGRALDVATGAGRVATWLAGHGLNVTAVDISPVGVAMAQRAAIGAGVSFEIVLMDLESEPLPAGLFHVITCFRYLQRELFPEMRERLVPGGFLFCEIATQKNLERHLAPSLSHLLETNELLELCSGMEIRFFQEAWCDGQYLARIAAHSSTPGATT